MSYLSGYITKCAKTHFIQSGSIQQPYTCGQAKIPYHHKDHNYLVEAEVIDHNVLKILGLLICIESSTTHRHCWQQSCNFVWTVLWCVWGLGLCHRCAELILTNTCNSPTSSCAHYILSKDTGRIGTNGKLRCDKEGHRAHRLGEQHDDNYQT